MPVYEYQGIHYDLPDGLSNEQAKAKILGHLGTQEQSGGFWEGTKGAAALVGDVATGMFKIPAAGVLAVGGKLADPSTSLQSTWESANKAIEETYPSIASMLKIDPETNLPYKAGMYPFEKYGDVVKWLSEKASMGNKDAEGALNILGSVLPIPFAGKAVKGVGKVLEKIDPGLRNVKADLPPEIKPEPPTAQPPTQPKPTRQTGGAGAFEDILKSQGVEIPIEPNSVMESMANRLTSNEANPDVWATQQIAEQRQSAAQKAIEERIRLLEENVKRQATLDFNAAERGRRENAPTGYNEWSTNKAIEEAQQTYDWLAQRQQSEIDATPHGDVPAQFGSTLEHGRIDENRIPIRADLSMEAQNLQNPLQRNLWGDELGPALGQKRSLTSAIDTMPPGAERNTALNRFRPPKGQSGRIDIESVKETIDKFKSGLKSAHDVIDSFTGAFYPREMERIKKEITDPKSRYGIALMSPDEFHRLAIGRSKEHMDGFEADNRRGSIRRALKSPEGLEQIPQLWIDTKDGKVFVKGHEGRHRMDVMKDMGIEQVPVMISHPTTRWGENPARPSLLWSETHDGKPGFKSSPFPEILNYQYDNQGKRVVPRSQRGSADPEFLANIATLGGYGVVKSVYNYVKGKPIEGKLPERPDSFEHPTKPETIASKDVTRTKVNASEVLRKVAPELYSVTTPEEAIFLARDANNPKVKDIKPNHLRDITIPGINAMVHLARNNPVLNFARYALQRARNEETAFVSKYVIGKEGAATLLGTLSDKEVVHTVEVMRDLSFKQTNFTPENLAKYGLNPKEAKWIESVRNAIKNQGYMAADSLLSAGREPFKLREGHLPGLVYGTHRTLIGYRDKNGVFKPTELVQFDTKGDLAKGVEAALKAAKESDPSKTWDKLEVKSSGLRKNVTHNNLFNGFNDVLNGLSKNNPDIGTLQDVANMKINEANHKWLSMDVHELNKKGIKGMTGDITGKDRLTNAKEYSKALIDFLEQGAAYYSHQKAFNEIGKVLLDPFVSTNFKNTVNFVNKHIEHVKGQNLSNWGAGINSAVDWVVQDGFGGSSKAVLNGARGMKTAIGIHMMGLYNPTFVVMQLTQVLTGAFPALVESVGKMNMHTELLSSAIKGPASFGALQLAYKAGEKAPAFIEPHMLKAYDYAVDHGIKSLSELEDVKRATQNKTIQNAKAIGAWPISVGELITRPPVFMIFADLFHKFGLSNEEGFMAAHLATQLAMGDYHPAERPKIYASLGIGGELAGALTTYKHNAVFNMYLRGRNAIKQDVNGKRAIAAGAAGLGAFALFQGITGAPGYDTLDSIYQFASSKFGERKSIRQAALESLPEGVNSGFLSAATGLDLNSRLTLSGALPTEWNAASPHISVLADWIGRVVDYSQHRDQQSFQEMVRSFTPSGFKGFEEQVNRVDQNGVVLDTAGQRKFGPEIAPRSQREQEIRSIFSVRPLRETIEQKDVYVKSKGMHEREMALNDIAQRYREAVVNDDVEGQKYLYKKFSEGGGDIQALQEPNAILDMYMKKQMSERERQAGMPSPTISSIRKQEAMKR